MFNHLLGGAIFGLLARLGQLGIQKRNIFENPGLHAVSMGVWGYAGYWAYRWEIRSQELIDLKLAEIEEKRLKRIAQFDSA